MAPNFAKLPVLLRCAGCLRRVMSQMNMRDEWLRDLRGDPLVIGFSDATCPLLDRFRAESLT
jgi:hypothetical protein